MKGLGVIGLGCILLCVSCGSSELTASRAGKAISVNKGFSLEIWTIPLTLKSPDCPYELDILESCRASGNLDYTLEEEVPGARCRGIANVELTEKGRQYLESIAPGTGSKPWTAKVKEPITRALVEVTRIVDAGPDRKKVEYRWKYVFSPGLEGCVSGSAHEDSAEFTLGNGGWRIR